MYIDENILNKYVKQIFPNKCLELDCKLVEKPNLDFGTFLYYFTIQLLFNITLL